MNTSKSKQINLLLMLSEPWKALAISGSSSMIKSFLAATLLLRSLITCATHFLKSSPISV